MRPEGSVALVTGASRGIGAAIARGLAEDGWDIAVAYRADEAGAEETVRAVHDAGRRAIALRDEIADPDAPDRLLCAAEERLGPVLALVNNAGVRADGLALQMADDEWDLVVDTNLSAPFRLTRRALKGMIRARYGRVVNVASIVGPRANAGQSNYAASKAGLIGMTKTIASEVARRNVTVNAVAPGFIDTDMTAGLPDEILASVPARRSGTPDEVAAAVVFLASGGAAYVTGSTLFVDGGMSALSPTPDQRRPNDDHHHRRHRDHRLQIARGVRRRARAHHA